MDTPKQTFSQQTNTVLHNSPACDRIKPKQTDIKCPACGFLLARSEPNTQVKNLLLYCRRCRKQVRVNLNSELEP